MMNLNQSYQIIILSSHVSVIYLFGLENYLCFPTPQTEK